MARFETWESYFYPETYNPVTGSGTLRNLFDERDDDVLRVLEYGSTRDRQRELRLGLVPVAHTFDVAHVRANMSKGSGRGFADVKTGEVDRYLGDGHRLVASTGWGRLDREEFGARAAEAFAYLNQAHPFREGNGRSSKVFMEHVAEQSRYVLDFERVTPLEWNQASEFSRPDLHAYDPVPDSLVPVFRTIAVDRPNAAAQPGDDASRERSPLRASYPQAATEAPRTSTQRPVDGPRRRGPGMPGQRRAPGRGEGR